MEFGLYLPCYYPDSSALTQAELFRQTVEQAHIAEQLGFTSVTIPEQVTSACA